MHTCTHTNIHTHIHTHTLAASTRARAMHRKHPLLKGKVEQECTLPPTPQISPSVPVAVMLGAGCSHVSQSLNNY